MNFITPGRITITAVRINTDIWRTIHGYETKYSYSTTENRIDLFIVLQILDDSNLRPR